MSSTVPIRFIFRNATIILGITSIIAVSVTPGLLPAWRMIMLVCVIAMVIASMPSVNASLRHLAGPAHAVIDSARPQFPGTETDNAGATAETCPDAANSTQNIQEVKRLNELGQCAAGIAHELNNPLGGILMYANLLAEDIDPSDPVRANIEKIIRETERCRAIVKRLLDIARQAPPRCTSIQIDELLTEAMNNINPLIDTGRVVVHTDLQGPLPEVQADGCQLQEVFENLLKNAVEAIDGEGEVFLATHIVGNGGSPGVVEVVVSDTGPGITQENLEHLFEPFYTTKRSGHGTGLGLSVSHSIIERHGGSITVVNRPEGGASFTVRIPIHGEPS